MQKTNPSRAKQPKSSLLSTSSKAPKARSKIGKTRPKPPSRSFFSLFKPKPSPEEERTPSPPQPKKLPNDLKLPKTLSITVPILSSTDFQSIDTSIFPRIKTISNHLHQAPGDSNSTPSIHSHSTSHTSSEHNYDDNQGMPNNFIEISSTDSKAQHSTSPFSLPKHTHLTIQHSQSPPPYVPHLANPTTNTHSNVINDDLRKYTSIYSLPPSRLNSTESDSAYYLPIIRTGAVPYALMQVRAASPHTSHLRLLGGPTLSSESTSIITASIHADLQSNHYTSSILDQFSTLYEKRKSDAVSKYREKFQDHTFYSDDQIALRALNDMPVALRYSIDGDRLNQISDLSLETKLRLQISANTSSSSLGRVVASHLTQRRYPADPPRDYHQLRKAPKNSQNITKVPKSTLPHAIHIIDYGEIAPSLQLSLEPTKFSPLLTQSWVYPQLFQPLFAESCSTGDQFNRLSPLLRLSTLLLSSQSLYPLVKRSNEGNIERLLKKRSRDCSEPPILSPFPSSLTPWYTLMKTMEKVTLQAVKNPAIADNIMNIYKLIEHEYWVDSAVHLRHHVDEITGKTSDLLELIEQLHPTLQAWLLPISYHISKPGAEHQNARGQKVNYREWDSAAIPSMKSEAQSLQWVPLVDLLHVDENLRPRFNNESEGGDDRVEDEKGNKVDVHGVGRRKRNYIAPDEHNIYTNVERLEHLFDVPKEVSKEYIEGILANQGPDVDVDDLEQLRVVQEKYELIRPDLSFAYQRWSKYYKHQLNSNDRKLLLSTSHLPPHNTPYISEFGQIVTTTVGHSYPIRHSHHEMLNDVSLKLYLGNLITQTRNSAFKFISEGRIIDYSRHHPSILHQMGLSMTEVQDFYPKSEPASTDLHRMYFDPSYTGITNQ